ncbi:mitochondrial fission factor homolog A-like [Hoplias malabaricus]|uniref:mitochondrial fission factor homolog A-like n=1 Tax=Hoplias malabaricus TaxID=27720 RepID=UPI003461D25B
MAGVDMAEINRIQYELEYTEGISQQMRIPNRLQIGPNSSEEYPGPLLDTAHSTMMHVPERIVVAGDSNDDHFSRPRDLDLIQSTPMESVELIAPPHVLTLKDQPLDFLEPEQPMGPRAQLKEETHSHMRSRRDRSIGEHSAVRYNGQINKYEGASPSPNAPIRACPPLISPEDCPNLYSASGVLSYIQCTTRRAYEQVLSMLDDRHHGRTALVTLENIVENTPDDTSLVDAAALRRQIIKLNRRLQLLEHENKERAKREMVMYSLTVAFWLVNTWIWLRR